MKPQIAAHVLRIALGMTLSGTAAAVGHYSKSIMVIEVANSDCYFFKLNGVGEADPVVANSPWFAIHKTQPAAREMFALLLTARASDATLPRVETTGVAVCGHAQVAHIDF